ncbi:hypothetical protein J2W98_001407 [Paenibacillus peoriae]|uniref:Uncharacterized protein n=1 Tax=Paenibacillus peoriae TaxID=59893 RepID=A0ABU1QC06_9BACL|nr:hypothetical protein [Paenibacillus peoriae]
MKLVFLYKEVEKIKFTEICFRYFQFYNNYKF